MALDLQPAFILATSDEAWIGRCCAFAFFNQTLRQSAPKMKKPLILLAIFALALGGSMPVSAAPKTPSPDATPSPATPTPAPEKSRPFPFHGDVAAVDSAAKTFTVKNKDGRERVFHVGENAKPTKDGWSGEFSAITVGSFATGTCTKTGNQRFEIATLHIGTKSVKKASPAPKAAATPKPTTTPKPG
jgi:hypothetical protein